MKQPKVLILGGGYAGLMAASRLARQQLAQVTLIDQSPWFEQRIRLHQVVAGQSITRGNLAHWLGQARVNFVASKVEEILPASRSVSTATGKYAYDYLIFALGSVIAQHRVIGATEHAHSFRSQSQCAALAEQVAALAQRGGHLLLVGGGLTHIETAAELAETYPALRITLACSSNPFIAFAPEAERYMRNHLQKLKVTLLEGCTVQSLNAGRCESSLGCITFDLCLCAPGFMGSPLLSQFGEPLESGGRLAVLPTLQLPNDERVLIAGDSAAFPWQGPVSLRMGCAVALPMGAQAGENAAALIRGESPANFSYGFVTRCVSLGRKKGAIQITHWDDTPRSRIITAGMGAWIKEQVCRMTFNVPRWELQTGLRLYRWPAVPKHALNEQAEVAMDLNSPDR